MDKERIIAMGCGMPGSRGEPVRVIKIGGGRLIGINKKYTNREYFDKVREYFKRPGMSDIEVKQELFKLQKERLKLFTNRADT